MPQLILPMIPEGATQISDLMLRVVLCCVFSSVMPLPRLSRQKQNLKSTPPFARRPACKPTSPFVSENTFRFNEKSGNP